MKDEVIIKCAECGSVNLTRTDGILLCDECCGKRCSDCGGVLWLFKDVYVCGLCDTVYSDCCYHKIKEFKRTNGEIQFRCTSCGNSYLREVFEKAIRLFGRNSKP